MAERKRRVYRDAGTAAAWARRLMWVQTGLSVLAISFVWMRGMEPHEAGPAEAALLLIQVVIFVAGAVLALRWVYLASSNARALGAEDMMVGPGWAVGWFFVPLLNLFMPYLTMRELWKASARPEDWQLEPAPAAIGLWWALWVASAATGAVGLQLSLQPEEAEGAAAELVFLASDLCFIPALLLFAWLIGRVQAMQERAARSGSSPSP